MLTSDKYFFSHYESFHSAINHSPYNSSTADLAAIQNADIACLYLALQNVINPKRKEVVTNSEVDINIAGGMLFVHTCRIHCVEQTLIMLLQGF